jgi:malate/lactate dehydrogenase
MLANPASNSLFQEDIEALTKRTQDGATEVVEAKAGKGLCNIVYGVSLEHMNRCHCQHDYFLLCYATIQSIDASCLH